MAITSKAAQPANSLSPAQVFALREAIARTGELFAELRAGIGAGGVTPPWDAVVLTCATESQAAAAREELERRRALALFPERCLLLALPDPPGRRVGSGGATLLALETLARHWLPEHPGAAVAGVADLFASRRVLLIHSGGESQRLPAYAALGKIFAPLPVLLPEASPRTGTAGGTGSAIFDWLYLLASVLPGAAGEVTLLSGDVMPVLNPLYLERERFAVRGLAIPVPAARGQQFGVYVPDADGAARRILQKPDATQLAQAGAVDSRGNVAVDTGIVTLRPAALEALLSAAGLSARGGRLLRRGSALLPVTGDPGDSGGPGAPGAVVGSDTRGAIANAGDTTATSDPAPWDLYRDYLPRLARESTPLSLSVSPGVPALDSALEAATRGLVAGVAYAGDGAFVHLGTSRDLHDAVSAGSLLRTLFPFTSQRDSAVASGAQIEAAFVGRSLLGPETELGQGAVADHCRAAGALSLGRDAMASGVHVPAGQHLRIETDRICYQTVINQGGDRQRVTVVLGIDDNPKLALETATFNGESLAGWLRARDANEADLWPAGVPHLLWHARLFVADTGDTDRTLLAWLQRPSDEPGVLARWRAARRYSLHQLLDLADAEAIAAERQALTGDIATARVTADVEANGDESFAGLFESLTPGQRQHTLDRLVAIASDSGTTAPPALQRARYHRILAGLDADGAAAHEDYAAAAVREAVTRPARGAAATLAPSGGRTVHVAAPVRIDFGGGWTDTPPFSLERGGAVLNAALTLDGELPLWAEAEILPEPEIVLEAADLGRTSHVRTAQDVAGFQDPSDSFALHKACLVLLGVISPADSDPLAALRAAGMGLRLRTGGRIPRGSGLGTSSIVGAAALRAAGEVIGRPQDDAELSRQTLELEQLMTTGGGWQDQMGAIAPGLKLVSTEAGMEQRPRVEEITFSDQERALFESHLVIAYTGYHRLAKNILRQVVMCYLGRDPLAMQALYQLRAVAEQLARAARALDFELFGTLVNQAWLLNKALDPQTSFPAIERLFSALAPHIYGAKLAGAGGGGFLVAVTRQPNTRDLVADLMARDRDFAYGYVVPHALWTSGLQVTRV